jgi:hypothetical protein
MERIMRKRNGFLLFWMVLPTFLLLGQTEHFTVTYTNSSSGIDYKKSNESPVRVFPGKDLPNYGQLSLKRGKWANLIFNGQKRKLEGPLRVDLAQLAKEMKVEKQSTFLGRFWNFLSNSVSQTNTASDIEKYHRRYLTNARAGISGFGDKTFAIQLPIYFTETLGEDQYDLHWDSLEQVSAYWVTIEARTNQSPILKAYTKDNQLTLHLNELKLSPNEVYKIQISAQQDSTMKYSDNIYFSFEPALIQDFIEDLKQEPEWKDLDQVEQGLYLVHQLEEEGFFQSARKHYQELIQQVPGNELYKKLFAAFLVRMDAPEEAKAVLNF